MQNNDYNIKTKVTWQQEMNFIMQIYIKNYTIINN